MIQLSNKENGAFIGTITEDELQFLIDQLEEENLEDRDYWLNRATLDLFREQNASENLLKLLETAMGDNDELEIVWTEI